ncbi:hypothetical protein AALP_AAs45543U000100 [Arabis alpina]|uniref:Uncharacterized protein n=1 Tax=Arabis alpina TaxID=50452 RepID=A0A087G165_ARAAL|nr:hypothetical protein AALP_AAs45543U000100 [Arabis alpina]
MFDFITDYYKTIEDFPVLSTIQECCETVKSMNPGTISSNQIKYVVNASILSVPKTDCCTVSIDVRLAV